jgi:hypothetical protein
MGVQGTEALVRGTNAKDPNQYLVEFLKNRRERLISMGDIFARTVTRINSYEFVVDNNPEWTNTIKALNNDGDEVTLQCDSNFTIPTEVKAIATLDDIPRTVSNALRNQFIWYLIFMVL